MANLRTPSGMNRDRRPGERRTLGAPRPGGAVWYVLGFLLVMALVQAWFLAPAGQQVSYSEFKRAIRSGQVAEVVVGEQTIRGTYKRDTNGGKAFNTTRIEDPKLVEDLEAAGVQAERADQRRRLRVPLQDDRAHVVQTQLARQHRARRSAPDDDHVDRLLLHQRLRFSRGFGPRPAILVQGGGLAASPVVSGILEMQGGGPPPFRVTRSPAAAGSGMLVACPPTPSSVTSP